jgi:hypothetical protein
VVEALLAWNAVGPLLPDNVVNVVPDDDLNPKSETLFFGGSVGLGDIAGLVELKPNGVTAVCGALPDSAEGVDAVVSAGAVLSELLAGFLLNPKSNLKPAPPGPGADGADIVEGGVLAGVVEDPKPEEGLGV